MRRFVRLATLVIVSAVLIPVAAFAQASITGVVRDTSGAILPGVTVEAASPALIERIRTVVTDGTGQYRIEDLRPGAYSVTFVLTGFTTVKREGIELTGSFTATVNAELKVGTVQETVTVTGESPDCGRSELEAAGNARRRRPPGHTHESIGRRFGQPDSWNHHRDSRCRRFVRRRRGIVQHRGWSLDRRTSAGRRNFGRCVPWWERRFGLRRRHRKRGGGDDHHVRELG